MALAPFCENVETFAALCCPPTIKEQNTEVNIDKRTGVRFCEENNLQSLSKGIYSHLFSFFEEKKGLNLSFPFTTFLSAWVQQLHVSVFCFKSHLRVSLHLQCTNPPPPTLHYGKLFSGLSPTSGSGLWSLFPSCLILGFSNCLPAGMRRFLSERFTVKNHSALKNSSAAIIHQTFETTLFHK